MSYFQSSIMLLVAIKKESQKLGAHPFGVAESETSYYDVCGVTYYYVQ
jgi:hypothetical protein